MKRSGRIAGKTRELEELHRGVNKTIKRVTRDLEAFQYNTGVSGLMELSNLVQRLRPGLEGTDVWSWPAFTPSHLLYHDTPIKSTCRVAPRVSCW